MLAAGKPQVLVLRCRFRKKESNQDSPVTCGACPCQACARGLCSKILCAHARPVAWHVAICPCRYAGGRQPQSNVTRELSPISSSTRAMPGRSSDLYKGTCAQCASGRAARCHWSLPAHRRASASIQLHTRTGANLKLYPRHAGEMKRFVQRDLRTRAPRRAARCRWPLPVHRRASASIQLQTRTGAHLKVYPTHAEDINPSSHACPCT